MNGSSARPPLVSLLTDFGLSDPYVGQMKAVLLARCPAVVLVDLTHQVRPHDVAQAADILLDSYRYFPTGTVHLTVVDPGVGSARQALVAQADGHFFVAPDNGLLSPVLEQADRPVVVAARDIGLFLTPTSSTFHGRDIFAPLAAALAGGMKPAELGRPVEQWQRLHLPAPQEQPDGSLAGKVIAIDRFGNLVTNLPGRQLPMFPVIEIAGRTIAGLSRCYDQHPPGDLLALVGSTGRLEIAVNRRSAQQVLGVEVGAAVRVRPGPCPQDRPAGDRP